MGKKRTKKIIVKNITEDKKISKKSKKPAKKKKKSYFGKEAHQAIVDYQHTECKEIKNDIYEKRIKPSFEKLAENLIFIHGFASSDYSLVSILKNDCVSFLYETLEKFG